jgi:Zn-dependent oligopeptidase
MGFPLDPGTYPVLGSGHSIGGYPSAVYGYVWSRVYADDLYTVFEGNLLNPDIGKKYREIIL